MEKKDKFKLLRDEDGVIIIHDGEAERREGYTREGFEKHISKEERLKSLISLNENKGIHDGWSDEQLDNEYQVLLEEIKKVQERNK